MTQSILLLIIASCMKKVIPVDLKSTVQVDDDLQIRAYYAGHVLGAAMFYAKVRDNAIVYTGDYNMTLDRHLGAAQIDKLQLDLVITESTYATTIHDSKYSKEREFLKAVHKCVASGGKVLIPTFALGRAQELCMLLDDYLECMHIKVSIYFSAGFTLQASVYYKMLISWTSQKVKETYATNNAFEFKNVPHFDRSMLNAPGPCVLFATPGMLVGGFSLQVFMQWGPFEANLVVLPGLAVVFLAFDVFFAIFCVVLACLIGIALCCCLPCIIAISMALQGRKVRQKQISVSFQNTDFNYPTMKNLVWEQGK